MEQIRRVVTGQSADGRAVITDDQLVDPMTLAIMPGFETIELWHSVDQPAMPDGLGAAGAPNYFPPPGGTVFRIVTFPPEGVELSADIDLNEGLGEAQAKVPDLLARLEPENPGMHTTDSLDYAIVLHGEFDLELDDGVCTRVRPGTVVVQRGTRHGWRNRSDSPARIAFVLIGATPAN